jgi:high affinity choline transporter 7
MPIYRQLLLRSFRPTLILLAFLVALGVYLYLTHAPVFWAGYVAIMFFYALVFYTGSAAASRLR